MCEIPVAHREMECDDFVDECVQLEKDSNLKFDECNHLYEEGMVFAAHQLMLKNIDCCADLGGRQSELYDAIKREHTLVFEKRNLIDTAYNWIECSSSEKGKGIDDSVSISAHRDNALTFLVHAQLDAGATPCIALASRLEYADEWIDAVSTSAFVRKVSEHSHIACLTITNPVLRMLGGRVLYVRVYCFNNILFDGHYVVIVTPLSLADAQEYNVMGAQKTGVMRFFCFSTLTFIFSSVTGALGSPQARSNANVKICIENMQIMRYTPAFFNSMICIDFFCRMCRNLANTARQLGDMLYEGDRLLKLVAFLDLQSLSVE